MAIACSGSMADLVLLYWIIIASLILLTTCTCVEGSSPTRGSSFFLGKVTALQLGVLCCFALFVCLTLLATSFLPSHLSLKNVYTCS